MVCLLVNPLSYYVVLSSISSGFPTKIKKKKNSFSGKKVDLKALDESI